MAKKKGWNTIWAAGENSVSPRFSGYLYTSITLHRAGAIASALILSAGAILISAWLFSKTSEVVLLANDGVRTQGIVRNVERYEYVSKGRKYSGYNYEIYYAGRSKSFRMVQYYSVGALVPVLYSKSQPITARITSADASVYTLIVSEYDGFWPAFLLFSMPVLMICGATLSMRSQFSSKVGKNDTSQPCLSG